MTVTYTDIVEAMNEAAQDGRTIDHAVVTELTKDELEATLLGTDDMHGVQTEKGVGAVNEFDVVVGDRNALIATDGTEYEIDA